jgi:hypothetical protein
MEGVVDMRICAVQAIVRFTAKSAKLAAIAAMQGCHRGSNVSVAAMIGDRLSENLCHFNDLRYQYRLASGWHASCYVDGGSSVTAAAKALMRCAQSTRRGHSMQKNEGTVDRGLRVSAGLILIGLAATNVVGAWGYIGIVPLLTGAIGMCPVYTLLRINTCPVNRR